MKVNHLTVLTLLLFSSVLVIACDSSSDGGEPSLDGDIIDGNEMDGDEPDGDLTDGDIDPVEDGDQPVDGDIDVEVEEEFPVDGDGVDGDEPTDGDLEPDGDVDTVEDGDIVDGDVADGDESDGDAETPAVQAIPSFSGFTASGGSATNADYHLTFRLAPAALTIKAANSAYRLNATITSKSN